MTYYRMLNRLTNYFEGDRSHAIFELRFLAHHALQKNHIKPISVPSVHQLPRILSNPAPAVETELNQLLQQRIQFHCPLQYLLGTVPFGPLTLSVKPPVLIPRWETEEWVLKVLDQWKTPPKSIVDLCTGSGCIALLAAHRFPSSQTIGYDIDARALTVARFNSQQTQIPVQFKWADVRSTIANRSNLILSNPPYVTAKEYADLPCSVRRWESVGALVGGSSGLDHYRHIAQRAREMLLPTPSNEGPILALEIGESQGPAVANLLGQAHFDGIHVWQDSCGKDRCVVAYGVRPT